MLFFITWLKSLMKKTLFYFYFCYLLWCRHLSVILWLLTIKNILISFYDITCCTLSQLTKYDSMINDNVTIGTKHWSIFISQLITFSLKIFLLLTLLLSLCCQWCLEYLWNLNQSIISQLLSFNKNSSTKDIFIRQKKLKTNQIKSFHQFIFV